MRAKHILFLLMGALLLWLGAVLVTADWQKNEIETGFTKEVSEDAFTMAGRLLALYNSSFEKIKRQDIINFDGELTIAENTVLVLDEGVLASSHELDSKLGDWVGAGGRLIYVLSSEREALGINESVFFNSLELSVIEHESGYDSYFYFSSSPPPDTVLSLEGSDIELTLGNQLYLESCVGDAYTNKNNQVMVCDLSYGDGHVTVIPSFKQFTNEGLRVLDHGAFLVWLVGSDRKVSFVPNLVYPSWLAQLWAWSWQFVAALVALLALFVWHKASRLGRAFVPVRDNTTVFSQHLTALADFLHLHGHDEVLAQALKRDFYQQLELRIPNIKMLSDEQQAKMIAKLTQFDESTIKSLLETEFPKQKQQRTEYVKRFKQLRNAL